MATRKKRKPEANMVAFGDVLADLDLEVSLRERLADTLESRITWALILQESLEKDPTASTISFKNSAFDALSAIEEPLDILFSRESPSPPQSCSLPIIKAIRPPPKQKITTARNSNTKFLYIRSADLKPLYDTNQVQTYLLRCPTCSRRTFTSLQGLLNHARIGHGLEWGTHDECVRACAVVDPDPDLQAGIEVGLGPSGILPGLRSLFQMAVGAPRSQELEVAMADGAAGNALLGEIDTGSHLTRTLGLHQDTPALAPFLGKQAIRRGINIWDVGDEVVDIGTFEKELDSISALSLKRKWRMPFKHRNVEDSSVDGKDAEPIILTGDNGGGHIPPMTSNGQPGPLAPDAEPEARNKSFDALRTDPESTKFISGLNLPTPGSRFHFAARVVLTDRSLWVPPDRRQETNGFTHKWMLSVESPSYSHNITTILQHLSVTSLSDSAVSSNVLTKSEPPFAVVGATDRPFLARVELVFNGVSDSNRQTDSQAIALEHWVELDLLKSTNGTIGDEQVVDIELDKRTILMPARSINISVGPKGLWNLGSQSVPIGTANQDLLKSGAGDQLEEGYGKILSSLVRKFPMTLKDIKNGRSPNPPLPYKLVSTPAQLETLVHGRRKAIEWGRARALRNTYTREINSPQHAEDTIIPLTTGDVFTWLSEEGHFFRPPTSTPEGRKDIPQSRKLDKPAEIWCPVCGQDVESHSSVSAAKKETSDPVSKDAMKGEDFIQEAKDNILQLGGTHTHTIPIPCNIAPIALQLSKLPMNNVVAPINLYQSSLRLGNVNSQALHSITKYRTAKYYRPAIIASAVPPELTLAVRKLIIPLNLPTFNSGSFNLSLNREPSQHTPGTFETHRSQVENHLAPHAILALATKQFIRILIEGALEVAKKEKATTTGLVVSTVRRKRRTGQGKDEHISLLTPVHILSSITTRGQGWSPRHRDVDIAIAGCLAKLGAPAGRHNSSTNDENPTVQGNGSAMEVDSGEFLVKTEQL